MNWRQDFNESKRINKKILYWKKDNFINKKLLLKCFFFLLEETFFNLVKLGDFFQESFKMWLYFCIIRWSILYFREIIKSVIWTCVIKYHRKNLKVQFKIERNPSFIKQIIKCVFITRFYNPYLMWNLHSRKIFEIKRHSFIGVILLMKNNLRIVIQNKCSSYYSWWKKYLLK